MSTALPASRRDSRKSASNARDQMPFDGGGAVSSLSAFPMRRIASRPSRPALSTRL
jgi:hypothetical protein